MPKQQPVLSKFGKKFRFFDIFRVTLFCITKSPHEKPVKISPHLYYLFLAIVILSMWGYFSCLSFLGGCIVRHYTVQLECKNKLHLEEGISVLRDYLSLSIHNYYRGKTMNVFFSSERKIIDIVTELFSKNTTDFSKLLYQSFLKIFSAPPPTSPAPDTLLSKSRSGNLTFVCPALGRISSHFGLRTDPVYEGAALHKGIDIATNIGSDVNSAADGTVLFAGSKSRWGNVIIIDHKESGYQTIYAHLNSLAVNKGKVVKAGQLIGYVGNTGKTTGPHLHYEIRYNGTALDPLPFLIPAGIIAD